MRLIQNPQTRLGVNLLGLKLPIMALVALLATVAIPALAKPSDNTHEYSFDNGLKLIVKEDHRAPVLVSQIWYKVGSTYEYDGISGISHALEHMMFKGTEKFPDGAFDRIVSENGGRHNAFTSQDYTGYYQEFEKSRLEVSFQLESDRMRGLLLPEKEFKKEIRVVMEERQLRTEDNPQALTYEQFNAAAFVSSSLRIPVVGWMNDLENMTIDDLSDWYEQWYSPNNATIVVVGDVDPEEVYRLAKKYFASIKSSKIKQPKPRQEIEQTGIRKIVVKAPAELPYFISGYKAPSLLTAKDKSDAYALAVLSAVLDGGNSSRFAKKLIRGSEIAANISTSYRMHSRGETLFHFDGTPAEGKTINDLIDAINAEIALLKTELVSNKELERIKAQVVASEVYQRDSVASQASTIGALESIGLDWRIIDEFVEKITAVTAKDIQRVAKKYLIEDKLTIAELAPQPLDAKQPRRASTHLRH